MSSPPAHPTPVRTFPALLAIINMSRALSLFRVPVISHVIFPVISYVIGVSYFIFPVGLCIPYPPSPSLPYHISTRRVKNINRHASPLPTTYG